MTLHTWIIGSGGLLGSALHQATANAFRAPPIPWHDASAAQQTLEEALRDFAKSTNGSSWRIIWAAGRATTATPEPDAERELAQFQRFINTLITHHPEGSGTFTLASSAGGVYAGSLNPPFTSSTPPVPIGTYGALKLAKEAAAFDIAKHGIDTTITRIANLYGPGQDLTKLQGVVSRLCLASITRQEINIFVSLDTLRDYIYVTDAAQRILHWSDPQSHRRTSEPQIRVVASGQSMGLGSVINTVQDVLHTRIPVSFGVHQTASAQARDIRLVPDTDAFIESLPLTPFPAGVRRVFEDLLEKRQNPQLMTNSLG